MSTPRFDPLNALENALLAAQSGRLDTAALIEQLLASQVFILLDRDPGPAEARDDDARPLLLDNAQGLPVLAMFSAPERAISMTMNFPQYGFGLELEFRKLLGLIRPGVGLVMNPGAVAGFELPASTVLALQAERQAP